MYRALGLLLLAAEGALAQSREPSDWDDNVPGYSNLPWAINWTTTAGTEVTCPCISTDCRPDNGASMTQSETNELQVTYMTRVPLKFAYLTDQDGTIISYKDGGWDTVAGGSRIMTFSWDSSQQPTGLVPHIVYADSCADVVPREKVWKDITKPDGPYTWRSVMASTWVRQAPPPPP